MSKPQGTHRTEGSERMTLPADYEDVIADALADALRTRDGKRVREVGQIAAELVDIEIERSRRKRTHLHTASRK